MLNKHHGYTFNPKTKEIRCCNGFGKIELIVKESSKGKRSYKIDGYGRCFFYYQVVCGDPVDTYTPFKPAKTPYKFSKEFEGISNDKDAWQYVVNEYKAYFGDITEYTDWQGTVHKGTWLDILQTYVNVVHMHRWVDDYINVKKTLDSLEVVY